MNLFEREKQWLLEEKYTGTESPDFFADVERLKAGAPLAYLIGTIPFLGTTIHLNSKPLIPRPETEYFVDYFLKKEIKQGENYTVLDLCAGSGCIGIAILYNNPYTHVDFGELKKKHIQQILENLHKNTISNERYKTFTSDMFESIPYKRYDHIIANPPYISKDRKDTVQTSVLEHEDFDALFAEEEGLFFIKKIIREGKQYLKKNGSLFIEFDPWQKNDIEQYALSQNSTPSFIQDQYNLQRFVKIQYKNH